MDIYKLSDGLVEQIKRHPIVSTENFSNGFSNRLRVLFTTLNFRLRYNNTNHQLMLDNGEFTNDFTRDFQSFFTDELSSSVYKN